MGHSNKRISLQQKNEILHFFARDFPASVTAEKLQINRNTINTHFNSFRKKIWQAQITQRKISFGCDTGSPNEDYPYDSLSRGLKKGGHEEVYSILGLLKKQESIFLEIIPECSKEKVIPIISGRALNTIENPPSGFLVFDGIIVNGMDYFKIFSTELEFWSQTGKQSETEEFWGYAKKRLERLASNRLIVHLSEALFRFNYREEDLLEVLLNKYNIFTEDHTPQADRVK